MLHIDCNLDSMTTEEVMIERRLIGDVHTIYDVSVGALSISEF